MSTLDQSKLKILQERRRTLAALDLERGRCLLADDDIDIRTLNQRDIDAIARALVHEAGYDTFTMTAVAIDQMAYDLLTESIAEDRTKQC